MNELKPGDRVLIECEVDVRYLDGQVWVVPLKAHCVTRTRAGWRPTLLIDEDDLKWRREEAASTLLELGEVNDPQSGEKKWA